MVCDTCFLERKEFRDLSGKMSYFSTASQTQPAEARGINTGSKAFVAGSVAQADAFDPFGGHPVCTNSTINCGIG